MPRGKSHRRSQAMRKRAAEQMAVPVRSLLAREEVPTRRGTGYRHRVRRWPISPFTGKSHKLVIPPESPNKKFVFVVGDSHLRHFADGFVALPEGCLSFGICSTPGASAAELEREIVHTQLDRTPSLVVLIAPSNNLTASRTVTEAAADFGRYLATVCSRWQQVVVLDFPPRLTVEVELQNLLSQEYHRVAARMGVKYFSVAEHFPMDRLHLWARDGVHLSDTDGGMDILSQLLWNISFQQLSETPPPITPPPVSQRTSPPVRRVTPRLVVTGPVPLPRPPPSEWTLIGQGKKNRPGSPAHSPGDPKRRLVDRQQVESVFSIPLSPVRFSWAILQEMDKVCPSDLDSAECTNTFPAVKKAPRVRRQKAVASKQSQPMRQVEAGASIVEVKAGSPTSPTREMVPDQMDVEVVGVTPGPPTSPVVILDTVEDRMETDVVGVTPTLPTSPEVDDVPAAVLEKDQMERRGLPRQHTQRAARRSVEKDAMSCICCQTVSVVGGEGDGIHLSFGLDEVELDEAVECHFDSVDTRADLECRRLPNNIRGSFHQGSDLFEHPGFQCMPIALIGLAKHVVCSVFSWQQDDLDRTLVLGDALYNNRREKNKITPGSKMLIVPNLPKKWDIDGQTFLFFYGDCLSGQVGIDSGEFIDVGVFVSLESGLTRMLEQYATCLFTVCGNTCAIISENGRYAVIDSHSRSATGMVDPEGSSVVVYFSSVMDLLRHFKRLARAFNVGNKVFEITGVFISLASESHSGLVQGVKCARPSESPNLEFREDTECDVLFTSEEVHKMCYVPISDDVCKVLCNLVNVEFEKLDSATLTDSFPLGSPCLNQPIVGDGNCYFRAISQAISGSQKNHRKIRLAVVNELEKNALKYQSFLRQGFSSVQDYIKQKKMHYVNSWATELEIQVTADYLGVDILTFVDGRWVKYGCSCKHLSSQAIYLKNHQNHYETVICVKGPNGQNCYGRCEKSSCALGYNTRSKIHAQTQDNLLTELMSKARQSKYVMKKKKLQIKVKYQEDRFFSEMYKYQRRENLRAKYKQQEMYKIMCINKSKKKYQTDLLHKEVAKTLSKEKYRRDKVHREKIKALSKEKYRRDKVHRENLKALSKEKYRRDKVHREKIKALSKEKYRRDKVHREKIKALSKEKYRRDKVHREKIKMLSKEKYSTDQAHRQKKKALSAEKYCKNESHREKMKLLSREKYHKKESHRQHLKKCNRKKYRNVFFRQKVKQLRKSKYHENTEYKNHILATRRRRWHQSKNEAKKFEVVMRQFFEKVESGTEFVCSVCHRLFFRKQVLKCDKGCYSISSETSVIADKCISEKYLHKCNMGCNKPCNILDTARGELWICYSCHNKMKKGQIPPECYINNLQLDDIPEDLSCLNSLEQHLISPHIAFMKILALPKGGQNGVHGPVTCVPANIVQTTNLLPRSDMDGSLLRVKLKRKLTYKGHYKYQFVDSTRIKRALRYLKQVNKYFRNIEFNDMWLNEFVREQAEGDNFSQEQETLDEVIEKVDSNLSNKPDQNDEDAPETAGVDELLHDRQQHCMFLDTCLMPVDIGQEVLDQFFEDIVNLAPAEGNNPVKLLSDKENEAKSFPVLFPKGRNTYHERRPHYLTLSRYFNNRIMHADGRFAQNIEYIFFAQYMSEVQQVISNVSVALRKGQTTNAFDKQRDKHSNTIESLKNLLEFDDGYRFLKPIRGTPAFWQTAQSDLLAMVRQLSIPTWFCSFSSADLRWQNLLKAILIQEGRKQTVEDLEWSDRCELLRSNPVTAARMFDYRWHIFLKEVLMSPSQPIGKITDYFYRVEFQQRGSPHVHALFWIEGAPKIDKNSDEEVVAFIDKYVTCELPPENDELFEIVTSVQQHSKRHSKTCKKGKTVCRFNFPRPVSTRTFIKKVEIKPKCPYCQAKEENEEANKKSKENDKEQCTCPPDYKKLINREQAANIMTAIKTAVSDENCPYNTVESLFMSLGINQQIFEAAYKRSGGRTQVILKRQVKEVWVNQYNRNLLKCWNANLDIQFVIDVYACIVYIISYISKSEREMGLLLNNAQKEANKGNVDAKRAMKKLGSVYLHNRDVSAQEAVYRLTSMHLKECSRKVVFIPTGDNIVRMSKPISCVSETDGEDDLWMKSIIDRYKNRPIDSTFNDMCMATFASDYRLLSKNEKCKKPIQLQNDCGLITKRTRTKPAVIRYARFSETKNPELFHKSMIQLFLPYRENLKPQNWETFLLFFENGTVRFFDGSIHLVKSVVRSNRSKFEIETEDLDKLQNEVNCDEVLEDAWCMLCPEQEVERLECVDEFDKRETERVEDEIDHIPDLAVVHEEVSCIEKCKNLLCRKDGLALIRSLNELQLEVFYKIRQWCLDKVWGKNPDPFHVFITGGAGTGKSHLIRAIQYEAIRLLTPLCRHPDCISVLLTAPTGIAAYNLKAATIHTTFHIGNNIQLPYTPLGEEKLNSLRAKYSELQILIIDEISMVHHKLLAYIHGRLRQIKQTGDFSPFGNVSIIAVGDFFQLPPVKGKALFMENIGVNLWTNFSMVELRTIMRQKDELFAQLLNRLRTHSKGTPMLKSDVQILKSCETGEVSSALHIFPTNCQVFEHNLNQLKNSCDEFVEIDAQDYGPNVKTGKLELRAVAHSDVKYTCLPEKLLLGKNARVMLCKNIDVNDGLVNGLCGTVRDIVMSEKMFPEAVYVLFDDCDAGRKKRQQSSYPSPDLVGCIRIIPEEERANSKGGVRRQFPLKLAWACTVHKVQGISLDKAVVSLKKTFAAGQAYVALSRVRSLDGLIIQDFKEKAIFCNNNIKTAIKSMPPFLTESMLRPNSSQPIFTLFLMNVQGLMRHVSDLAFCTQFCQPNCIAVTETWLSAESSEQTVQIDGFRFHSSPRSYFYRTSTNPALTELQCQQHGGVGMYCDENVAYEVTVIDFNLECLICHFRSYNIIIAVIYRPPSYAMSLFRNNLETLLNWLHCKSDTIAIVGDFNDNILKSSNFCQFMSEKGYSQYVVSPTTERGSLIDHVYVKTSAYKVQSTVMPAYFSDHEGIVCSFMYQEPS